MMVSIWLDGQINDLNDANFVFKSLSSSSTVLSTTLLDFEDFKVEYLEG